MKITRLTGVMVLAGMFTAVACAAAEVYSVDAKFPTPDVQRVNLVVPCALDITSSEGLSFDLKVDDISEFRNIYCYVCVTGGNHWLRLRPLRADGKTERIVVCKSDFEGTEEKPADWKVSRLSFALMRSGNLGSRVEVSNVRPLAKERRWCSSLSDKYHLGGLKTWEEGVKGLAEAGFTDLVVQPPRVRTYPEAGDPVAACRKYGLRCHACYIVFSRPWDRKYGDNFLDPASEQVQQTALKELKELVDAGYAGISLDYIRYSYDQKENEKFGGVKPEVITAFVKRAHDYVKSIRPDVEFGASVFENPAMGSVVGQDWGTWLDRGYVDWIKPMIYYTANDTFYMGILDQIKKQVPNSWQKVVPMIGIREWPKVGEWYDKAHYHNQRDLIRAAGFGGYAVYQLEPRILKAIR